MVQRVGEEIWEADSLNIADLPDDELLVATGSRNQNGGFLARGGAGGEPIFMGDGNVQGFESQERSLSRRKSSKGR